MIRWMAAAAAGAALLWASSAAANRLDVTYEGQVTSGSYFLVDPVTGVGNVVDLAGLSFTFSVLLDTDRAAQRFTDPGVADDVQGTTDGNSPLVYADLMIGTYDFPLITGDYSAIGVDRIDTRGGGVYETESDSYRGNILIGLTDFVGPASLEVPFTTSGSQFVPGYPNFNSGYFGANAELNATTLTVTPAAAAPEPGLWALMVVGVGLAGAALRRRPGAAYSAL